MRDPLIDHLAQIYPPDRLLTAAAALATYESDALTAYRARPLAVVLPENQQEVIDTVRLCYAQEVPFVARGSGTSLSGGALPLEDGIVIGLNRLNRVLRVDPKARLAVVEAGVFNLDVSRAAATYGLIYAPDPSSQAVCTVGGNVAFNSGGAHCLKYGMTGNHVLGIKAVLGDGQVVHLGGESQERIGPDLAGLFVGSEGLFGIALEITLRLLPRAEAYRTLLAAYPTMAAAGDAVAMIVASGLLPGAMEIMDPLAVRAAEAAVQAGYPLDAGGLLIVELDGEKDQVETEFEHLLAVIEGSGASEMRTAQDEEQRARIWKGRKGAFAAVGRLSPNYIVQDGVVPRSKLGLALAEIDRLSRAYDIPIANVFHAGDGNLHPLILYSGQANATLERAEELAGHILQLCVDLGGSITGEHGVGVEKRAFLPIMYGPADMDAMRRIRFAMDPKELANRGKMLVPYQRNGDATRHPTSEPPGSQGQSITAQRFSSMGSSPEPGLQPVTVAAVQAAVQAHSQVVVRAGGSKPALSTPPGAEATVLDLSHLRGIIAYDPAEYTFTALAGTPLAEVDASLAAHGQYLPFDPPLSLAGATLGGTVAAGLSGPGSYRFGGVRDFILGVTVIDGGGQLIRGGGRVVKNAAGFDLPKLMVGSLGRLGVLVELTFKVFPRPAVHATWSVDYVDQSSALESLYRLLRAPLDLEALDLEPTTSSGMSLWVRIGGRPQTLPQRLERLRQLLGAGHALEGPEDEDHWRKVANFHWAPPGFLAKVPLTPARITELEAQVGHLNLQRRYSAGGSVAWLAGPDLPVSLTPLLATLGLRGLLLRGSAQSPFLGAPLALDVISRVKSALDAGRRFPAFPPASPVP